MLSLVHGAYMALNASKPSLTEDCWICLSSEPPYYEGIALNANITNQTTPGEHCKLAPHQITLAKVSGTGHCLGKPPTVYNQYCNKTEVPYKGNYYLIPPNGTYWACNTGLTPCIFASSFNTSGEFCILVQLWPCIYLYSTDPFLAAMASRAKREPVATSIALLLGFGGIAAGTGTGTAALIQNDKLRELHMAMTTDLEAIEKSVTTLEKSLTSLSEVVLQNR